MSLAMWVIVAMLIVAFVWFYALSMLARPDLEKILDDIEFEMDDLP